MSKMRRYMVGIRDGVSPAARGMTHTTYVLKSKLVQQAAEFKKRMGHDEVYLVQDYTQGMCEMEPKEFTEHVRERGTRLA